MCLSIYSLIAYLHLPTPQYEFYEESIGCFLLTARTFKIFHF